MTDVEPGAVAAPTPAPVKIDLSTRVVKPDKSAHDRELNRIQSEIKTVQERINVIRAETEEIQSGRGGFGEKIQQEKAVFLEIRAVKDKLIQERNVISSKLKEHHSQRENQTKSQKALRSEIKFTSHEDIQRQIADLTLQQETQSMSLAAEKKMIKEIESLKQSRKLVSKFSNDQEAIEKCRGNIKEIRTLLDAKNAEIDQVQLKIAAQKKILDNLYDQNNSGDRDQFPKLIEERKALKLKLDEKYTAMRSLRSEFKDANDHYYAYIRALREHRKEEQKLEDERRQEEYQKKLAAYEKEMEKIHPYQDEMDLCDALLKYLDANFSKDDVPVEKSETVNSYGCCDPVQEYDGMKLLQREEEDYFLSSKSSKKNGKKNRKTATKAKLAFPIAQMDSFTRIEILPPSNAGAVPEVMKSIQERKSFLKNQTTRPKNEKPKKKAFKNAKDGNLEEFPSLGEAVQSSQDNKTWGPSSNTSKEVVPTDDE